MIGKILLSGLVAAALAIAVLAGLIASTFPKAEGEVSVPALAAPVTITRDADGIPTVEAPNADLAAFGLGYAHAQDRFFQMELMRRLGAGRLAELVGGGALPSDRFMRTLGLYRLAQGQVAAASPELAARLTAYAEGVNAWLNEKSWPQTIEFLGLPGVNPEPWRPADSLVWGKLMAMRLAKNWRTEHFRERLGAVLTPAQIDFLWPAYPPSAPVDRPVAPPKSAARALPDVMDQSWDPRSVGAPATASNAWVLHGGRTKSGKTVLVNDPHLGFRAPILWYLARLKTPDGVLTGATVPGVPFVIIGNNGTLAWGFTTTGADTEDLIIDGLTHEGEYETPEGPRPLNIRAETIVFGDGNETTHIRSTAEGPVISSPGDGKSILSLAAPYLRPGDRTPEALLKLNRAETADDVDRALADFHAPVQNVFFAGDGFGGYRTAGRIPIRSRGDGTRPLHRLDGPVEWRGYVPHRELPRADLGPDDPALFNANNKITPPGYPHLIARHWDPPFRAMRLAARLANRPDDPAAPLKDKESEAAKALIKAAFGRSGPPDHPIAAQLTKWDGVMDRTRREPLAFYHWALALKRRIFADELGPLFNEWHGLRTRAQAAALENAHDWCDDKMTEKVETCAEVTVQALEDAAAAVHGLSRSLGRPAVWGDVHRARFDHPVFSRIPILKDWVKLDIATDGGHYTLDRGGMYLGSTENPFAHVHGAGLRMAYDADDPAGSRFVIATGQSGNPLSRHYGDFLERWRDGRFVIPGKPRAPLQALRLVPEKP